MEKEEKLDEIQQIIADLTGINEEDLKVNREKFESENEWINEVDKNINKIAKEQVEDKAIKRMKELLELKAKNVKRSEADQMKHYIIIDDILYRRDQQGPNIYYKLFVPFMKRNEILRKAHDEAGHFGINKTLKALNSKYYWKKMADAVARYVKTCVVCQVYGKGQSAPPQGYHGKTEVGTVGEMLAMDYAGPIETSSQGNKYILVVTDLCSKYVIAGATKDNKAITAAQFLENNVIWISGAPKIIISDRGSHFIGKVMETLLVATGIKHNITTAYHPQANANAERRMGIIKGGIGKLWDYNKRNWDRHLGPLIFAYNTAIHKTTGITPFELWFARQARTPLNSEFEKIVLTKYENAPQLLKEILWRVSQLTEKAHTGIDDLFRKAQSALDPKRQKPRYQINDEVLLEKMTGIRGERNALAGKYSGPYIVKDVGKDGKTLIIEDEKNATSRVTINRIMPFYSRNVQDIEIVGKKPQYTVDPDYQENGDKENEIPENTQISKEDMLLYKEGTTKLSKKMEKELENERKELRNEEDRKVTGNNKITVTTRSGRIVKPVTRYGAEKSGIVQGKEIEEKQDEPHSPEL
jgi:transposase InsO family protein